MSRVTDIRYVGYGVEDFDAERAFYADNWGLVEVAAEDGVAWFKTHGDDEHHVVRLHRSDANHVELASSTPRAVAMASASSRPTGCRSKSRPMSRDRTGARSNGGKACPCGSATSCCIRPTTRRR